MTSFVMINVIIVVLFVLCYSKPKSIIASFFSVIGISLRAYVFHIVKVFHFHLSYYKTNSNLFEILYVPSMGPCGLNLFTKLSFFPDYTNLKPIH